MLLPSFALKHRKEKTTGIWLFLLENCLTAFAIPPVAYRRNMKPFHLDFFTTLLCIRHSLHASVYVIC